MPVNDAYTQVVNYPMSKRGVNIHDNILELHPEECLTSQNLVWENGMVKRGGQSLVSSTEVVSSKKILGLHRFYLADGTAQTLAACDTVVKTGTDWATSVKTGLTAGLNTNFATWGALNKVYICNGTDKMHSWDGSSSADITIADGVPLQALPYQDRLLTIIGGFLTWSGSYDDTGANWVPASQAGVKPDSKLYGMCLHSASNEASSNDAKVLLAGSSGMYLFYGKDLRPIAGVQGDYSIFPISIPVGCSAPKTMCWTPRGTMWLGNDRQVYLLPFDSVSPIPVAMKIRSNINGVTGIESIPSAQVVNACAAYHDGYYKLSIAGSGNSVNNVQWWADVKRGFQDENNEFGPWYGPMIGQSISCFANMNGVGDVGQLMGGESNAKGYVYFLGDNSVYSDIEYTDGSAKEVQAYWQTYYNPLGNENLRKDVHKIEAALLDVLGTVIVNFLDIEGSLKVGQSFGLSGAAIYWNDNYWDEQYWSSSMPTRRVVDITPAIQPRRLSITVSHNSSVDTFELYSLNAEVKEQAIVFA